MIVGNRITKTVKGTTRPRSKNTMVVYKAVLIKDCV